MKTVGRILLPVAGDNRPKRVSYSPADIKLAISKYTGTDERILRYIDVLFQFEEAERDHVYAILSQLTEGVRNMGPIIALEIYGALAEYTAKEAQGT